MPDDKKITEKDFGNIIPNIKNKEDLERELLPSGDINNYLKPLDDRRMVPASEFFNKKDLYLDFTPEEAALIRYLESGDIGMPEVVRRASMEHLERVSMIIALKGTHILHDMMLDNSLEPEIRKQIAQDMINRQLGLPTQKVRVEDQSRVEVFSRMDADEMRKNQEQYIELKRHSTEHIVVFDKRKDAFDESE